jgi:asparagine synthase (glutamine-hydrolysing)
MLFAAIQGRSTVALSGESADEVFGGYQWFHDPAAVGRDGFPWVMDDVGFGNVLAPDLKARVRPEEYVRDRYAEALAEVPRLDGETGKARRMREVSYLALTRFLPVLLDRKDRMSMAVGLEVRVPYCDHRLVEYLWNVPWELKCPEGVPKGLLRQAAEDLLPAELVHRPKSMYPATPDPTYDLSVRAGAQRLVESDSAVGPLLDADRVRALVDGTSRRPPWMQRLALAYLIQIDRWMRNYTVRVAVTV